MAAAGDGSTKDIQLTLEIQKLVMNVPEKMPVMVIWQRGNKKASTKRRLLSETVS